MGRREFKPGALTAPLPAVLVTVSDGDKANVITIGWTGILSTHPARTYISVRPERHSYKMLKATGEFVINLTTAKMAREVDFAGVFSGRDRDKLAECGFTAVPSSKVAPPTIAECPFALECRVVEVIPMGTHDVFIADIVSVSADDGIIDADGRLRFDRAGLMAYAHGEYFALGESLGKFGFSARKGRKEKTGSGNRGTRKGSDSPGTKRKNDGGSQHPVREDTAVGEEKKRPFYLDAPRKKGRTGGTRRGGKK